MTDELKIKALDDQHGLQQIARITSGKGGLPRIQVETEAASAEIYLYGAQVMSWRPVGFEDVLFVSEKSNWEKGKPIRGGIPVCFPWFRGKPDDKSAPTHGFVRTKEWNIDAIQLLEEGAVEVCLSTESDAESRAWWPHDFRLEYSITVGRRLMLALKMHNTGPDAIQFQEALHTYFKVGDVQQAVVKGLGGVRFLDNRDHNREKQQNGDLALTKQTDNAYLDATGPVEILDPALGRTLTTQKRDSNSSIVWNPWSDGAAALADFGDQEWRGMLCVEGGNVLGQPVSLGPAETHTMTISLSTSRLQR